MNGTMAITMLPLAGLPASAWRRLMIFLTLLGAMGVFAIVRMRRRRPQRRGFPLSIVALIIGSTIGSALCVLDVIVTYPHIEWAFFVGYLYCSTAISVSVAAALAVFVDLPAWTTKPPISKVDVFPIETDQTDSPED